MARPILRVLVYSPGRRFFGDPLWKELDSRWLRNVNRGVVRIKRDGGRENAGLETARRLVIPVPFVRGCR